MTPTAPATLSPDELKLLEELDRGTSPTLKDKPLVIQAWVIARMLMGYSLEIPSSVSGGLARMVTPNFNPVGLRLSGCIISGDLRLDHACRLDGAPIPTLIAEDCLFLGSLSAKQSHVRGLHLVRCGIMEVDLADANVVHNVELIGCRSRAAWLQECQWMPQEHRSRLESVLNSNSARFCARANLERASIGKRLSFEHSSFNNQMDPLWSACLLLEGVRVGGNLRFDKAVVSGGVYFRDASILGSASFSEMQIDGSPYCLDLMGTKVGGTLWMKRLKLSNHLDLTHVSVEEDLNLIGASIGKHPSDNLSLRANFLRVDGDLWIADDRGTKSTDSGQRFKTAGTLAIRSANIAGNVYLRGVDFSTESLAWFRDKRRMHLLDASRTAAEFGSRIVEMQNRFLEGDNWGIDEHDLITILDLEGSRIGCRLTVDLTVPPASRRDPDVPAAYFVSLIQLRAADIDDLRSQGWGFGTKLNMDGFETARLNESGHKVQTLWRKWKNYKGDNRSYFVISLVTLILEAASAVLFALSQSLHASLGWFWGSLWALSLWVIFFVGLSTIVSAIPVRRVPVLIFGMLLGPWAELLGIGDTARIYRSRLNRQYVDPENPTLAEFHPGVYEHLARQLSGEGYDREARAILGDRYRIHRRVAVAWFARPFWWSFDLCFNHGFSPLRALATLVLLIYAGGLAVNFADKPSWLFPHEEVLVVTTSTVNTLRIDEPPSKESREVSPTVALAMPISPDLVPVTGEIPCGSRIDPYLYAAEIFVPALNLNQTAQCEVSSAPTISMRIWRTGRACYTILGWLVTSITVLTVPGYLRRRAERPD